MRSRRSFWVLLGLLLLAGAWFFWPHGNGRDGALRRPHSTVAPAVRPHLAPSFTTTKSGPTVPQFLAGKNSTNAVQTAAKTNQFPWRLTNTKKTIGELTGDRHAILLENALIDTGAKLDLAIPKNLQAQGDPGAYIVQARGPIDAVFRAQLAAAGAQIVSYIPNNAYLVRVPSGGANELAALPLTQSVIPYEPYYKISSTLIGQAVEYPDAMPSAPLTLGLFANDADATIAAIENLGGQIIATGSSPFGPTVQVIPPKNWTALATLPGVQIVEPFHQRMHANDLSRQTTGVSADSVTTTNYLNLNGMNVMVAVDDSGIDALHPDLVNRVFGAAGDLVDTDGHGTFVAGQIAGDGTESITVTNVQGSINPGTNFQYRGKAPLATMFSVNFNDSDEALQAAAALTNALISNNSWNYADTTYDLAAASYDAATRDALPQATGSQPVLFVFSAGNIGNGDDTADPGGGNADTILSPATAKNVITVGAIQQLRNITNLVTEADGTTNAPWAAETSTDFRIAGFSSRGNVGIGTEGPTGRDKPDVVAPGTFVVSTRSEQWDIATYFFEDPTNHNVNEVDNIIAQPDSIFASAFPFLPNNTIQATIQVLPDPASPVPFPFLPIYVGLVSSTGYDFFTTNNAVSIPPDGGAGYLNSIFSSQNFIGFNFGVSNITAEPISFDLITDVVTTNATGNYFEVLSNLDQSIGTINPLSTGPGPYYRYETGTSMAAADVSGVLALMQDFFTNTLHAMPSPALMKAMLINGARPTGFYNLGSQNTINYEGWGLVNLPNSLPLSITNLVTEPTGGTNTSVFFLDQSPTNALATGDSQTFTVTVNTNNSTTLPLRVTLAWTDPPGNPAAAIKLVNNLDLVVTNLTTGDVYFGNDIPAGSDFNSVWDTNGPPNLDTINNIENVFLSQPLSGSYSVTVIGRDVNVNAVTAQTNSPAGNFAPNAVQDYALVVSCGDSADGGAITVANNGIASNPTGDQQITFVTATNTPLFNQFAGGNTPLLGTNTVEIGGTNQVVTVGMTNQWHFYVVTNTGALINGAVVATPFVAFITFLPETLAIPRMGAFADSAADATQPEADIDMYVTSAQGTPAGDPNAASLTNLNPNVISNCVSGLLGDGASQTRGGIEFVAYSNSAFGQVYYVGVKAEDQEAAEYAFIPIFSATPFSQQDANGNEYVQGVPLPVNIPDGSLKHPGSGYIFALAIQPIEVGNVVVTNMIVHQNFGDLIGVLSHNGTSDVLNNHDSFGNPPGPYTLVYDDSGSGNIIGSQPSDGPGSLNDFQGQQAVGPWILTESDTASTQTGYVTNFNLFLEKHQDPTHGINVSIAGGTWFYTFIDVPAGFTNLTISATNLAPTVVPPLQLYLNVGVQPNFSNFLESTWLTNCVTGIYPTGLLPGNSLVYGPPLQPGRYFIGIFNPSFTTANAFLIATLGGTAAAIVPADYATNGPVLLDDAAGNSTIFVANTQQIASINVGMVVNHPRISDLTFTLVSPTGQRVLLMENRGGSTTNGAGDTFITTNSFAPVTANGGGLPQTNFLNVGETSGTLTINYDMFTIPDEMTVYYGTNSASFTTNLPNPFLLFDTGFVSGTGTINVNFGPGTSTFVTVIMNQFGNPAGANGTAWTYTAGGIQTNFNYLTFTEDTNLATIPIKFAVPPFVLNDQGTNYTLSDFDLATNGTYLAPTNIFDPFGGWSLTNQILVGTNLVTVTNNEVSVVTDPDIAGGGSNYLALANGTIFRQIPMTVGRQFSLSFQYRGPAISAWYRGEGNATDSSDPENLGNNGWLIGRFNFPAGEVGQAFQMANVGNEFLFAGTNSYVQIRQAPFLTSVLGGSESNGLVTVLSSSLDVGTGSGLTVEGWINPTNVSFQQPLVEWLARTPTNLLMTNLVILAGPYLNRDTSHYYYLLGSTNWFTSELWGQQLGGHLVTIETANEQNWVFDTFANYGGVNRNLWIGLRNTTTTNFVWSSGLVLTNTSYVNWLPGEPTNCEPADLFTTMLGGTNAESGLWLLADNNGHNSCNLSPTNQNYGVVEVNDIQTNGVQFWISVTNAPGATNSITTTNGCLFANLMDVTNGSHFIFSAPGLIQSNVFQHVALTYDTNSGIANLYLNGTNVASTNLGYFIPKTTGDVLLGKDMSRATNNYYGGEMDEMSIYARALSASEIAAIYQTSALTTNRNIGKFDPAITPGLSLAEAQVSLGTQTNVILGLNDIWQSQSFSFTATTNSLPMVITGLEPGMLLDTFSVSEAPLGNLYYLPEQALDSLDNTSAFGTWTLEILDNRTGAFITNGNQLVSWQLQIVLQTNLPAPIQLSPQDPSGITVPPGQVVYLSVPVPTWANFATNILVSSDLPVDLLFNQTNPPTGSNPGDFTLLTGSTGGIGNPVLAAAPPSVPPLLPGQTYLLGVRNNGAHAASVVVEVDFDITALTNGVPLSSTLNTNDSERYFSFNVSSNAFEATFQLLKLSSNADLVIRKGAPLPTLTSSDYGSFNVTNVDENIFVLTNSSPVPLSPGLWYLGVFKRDAGPVNYTVLAKELDTTSPPTVIPLTNGVPFNFTAGPGAALTNFFSFTVTNSPASLQFELYNLTGNGDLIVQTNVLPLSPPFFQSSQQPGQNPEFIFIQTNGALSSVTNSALTNLNATWYLGVPNHEARVINYTILALINTNPVFPAFPGAEGAGAGALGGGGPPATSGGHGTNGTVYHVINLNDSGAGSLRDAVSSTNRTIVFDLSGTINLASPLVITNSYLTIAGQTAPGVGGITVAGNMTAVQSGHDLIIRDIRFRPDTNSDSLQFTNVSSIIADHVSASWSANDEVSVLNSSNVTVQWSIMADGLNPSSACSPSTNQDNGSLLRYGSGTLSFHHNLYADNYNANPRLGDNLSLDFVNNVIYDWGTNAGFSLDDTANNPSGFTNQLNYVGNYLIASANASLPGIAFWGGSTNTWIFQTNNFIDSDTNHILNGADTDWNMFTNLFTRFDRPFPLPVVPTDEAFLAYEKVLDFAGDSLSARDGVDAGIVNGVRTQTGSLLSVPALSGLVAWWKAENNTIDSVNANNGTAIGELSYTNGEVGQAFQFDGVSGYVSVPGSPSLDIGATGSGVTIECWVNPNHFVALAGLPIVEWDSPSKDGLQLYVNGPQLFANIQDTAGNFHVIATPNGTLTTGVFQHVALTYDKCSGLALLYINGSQAAAVNIGSITPQTSYPVLNLGKRTAAVTGDGDIYNGLMDEVSLYNRALSASEIASIYNAGSAGKFASSSSTSSALPPLDTDQDGLPDYWEITFGQNPTNASSFLPSTAAPGYTDLEEYLNWLASPHALTITNTPVSVDLLQLFGKTGNLSFLVTNNVQGYVYLTNVLGSVTNTGPYSNSIAVFTPTNNPLFAPTNYSGYAAFDVWVTNNDTVAYFGPVTVSVVVSAVPVVFAAINTNTPPVFSTNAPANQIINELTLMTVTNTATDTNANVTLTYTVSMVVDTAAMVASNWPTIYATTTPSPVIDTNGVITWTPSEAQGPGVYTITTIVSDNGIPPASATNSFTVTVNEVNLAPFFPSTPPDQTIPVLSTLTVTNTAMDSDIPPNPLMYQLSGPAGATIDTNGVITWASAAPGTFTFTTVVTDTNAFALFNNSLSATNSFTVNVVVVAAPFAFTQPATAVTGTGAQLNGMATPNGLPAMAWFEWGTSTAYGNQTPPVSVGASFNVVYMTNQISGLVMNVPYHYRLVVSNSLAVVDGFDQILDEANVVAWGANFEGQLNVPLGLSNVTAIAGAYDHNLALKNNETAVGWGDNTFGQMAVPPGLNNNLVAVAGGESYSLALKNSGTVVAWGANIFPGETNVPAGLNNVVTIASGQYSSMALKNNGTIVAWGANISGLTNVPAGFSNAVAIAGGSFHNLAIKNDGTVMAWGDNSAGQTAVPAGLSNVVAISGGSFHSLALQNNGTVVAWGDNSAGQTNVPSGLNNVVAIAAGGFHSLALKNDGSVVAWGDSSAGQTNAPAGLNNVVAIAAGNLHSLALTPFFNVNPTNPIVLNLSNGVPQTSTVGVGGIVYYQVNVPANADFATNSLLFAPNGPLNVWFITNAPPTIATNATLLFVGSTNSVTSAILSTSSAPTNITPGATYYLGVQNTNNIAVTYGIEVDFHLLISPPVVISSITQTNINGTNGFLLTWFAPSNDLFQVQWTTNLASPNWGTFTNIISQNTNAPGIPPNAQFNFFDDGSQTGGLSPIRFYRLILLQATNPPAAPVPIGGITSTNVNGTNAFLLTWFAPTNDLFQVQWTTNLAPANWSTFTNIIAYTGPATPTNGLFIFLDDGSQTGGTLGTMRFYRLLLLTGTPTNAPVSPFAAALPARAVTGTGAQLNGFATPNGLSAMAWFEWGASRYYGSVTAPVNVGSGNGVVYVNNSIAGLVSGQSYHYRLVVSNATTVVRSFDQQFAVGGVVAWGDNSLGQTNVPASLTNAVAVAAGGDFGSTSYALKTDGTVTTWGYGGNGQTNVPAGLNNVVAVAGSGFTSLALKNNGTVVGWGDNSFGQTNIPAGLSNVVEIAVGDRHDLALKNNGTVVAWGDNTFFQTNVPAGLSNVVAISCGSVDNQALKNDGTVIEWGSTTASVPAGLSNVVAVAGGGAFSLALQSNSTVVAWGTGIGGLGIETNIPANLSNVVVIAAGGNQSIAVKSDGTAVAWGYNDFGQTNVPAGLSNVVAVASGAKFCLVLTSALTNSLIVPSISSISIGTNGVSLSATNGLTLKWNAPVYEAFQVQWTTNLVSPVTWSLFPPPPITSTSGVFGFTDTNAPLLMKFYQLILLP